MKPDEHIKHLMRGISDSRRIKSVGSRYVVDFATASQPMTFLLHKGVVSVHRSSDDMLFGYLKAPMIVGLNFLTDQNFDIYFRAQNTITYETIYRHEVKTLTEQKNLWEQVARTTMYISDRMMNFIYHSTALPTYDLIKNNLLALMQEPEHIRYHTNACEYIRERTMLSRSRIMKILRELKTGDYIDLHRGILLNINKLPLTY